MSVTQQEAQLAIHGGPKAVPEIIPSRTKISAEELWEIIDMWDFSGDRKDRIRELIFEEGGVCGPHLFRY